MSLAQIRSCIRCMRGRTFNQRRAEIRGNQAQNSGEPQHEINQISSRNSRSYKCKQVTSRNYNSIIAKYSIGCLTYTASLLPNKVLHRDCSEGDALLRTGKTNSPKQDQQNTTKTPEKIQRSPTKNKTHDGYERFRYTNLRNFSQ